MSQRSEVKLAGLGQDGVDVVPGRPQNKRASMLILKLILLLEGFDFVCGRLLVYLLLHILRFGQEQSHVHFVLLVAARIADRPHEDPPECLADQVADALFLAPHVHVQPLLILRQACLWRLQVVDEVGGLIGEQLPLHIIQVNRPVLLFLEQSSQHRLVLFQLLLDIFS